MDDSYGLEILSGLLAGSFAIVIVIVGCVLLVALLAVFLLTAFSLYQIAQRRGIEHPYLAWIPFAQDYLFAEIIGTDITIGTKTIPQFPWIYVGINYGFNLILSVLAAIPVIGMFLRVLSIPVLLVINVYVLYRFYKVFAGGNEVVFTILSAVLPISRPFILLFLRKRPFADEEVLATV